VKGGGCMGARNIKNEVEEWVRVMDEYGTTPMENHLMTKRYGVRWWCAGNLGDSVEYKMDPGKKVYRGDGTQGGDRSGESRSG